MIAAAHLRDAFETFWARYPVKVGKLAARKAYVAACAHATPGELLAGLDRYLAHKPEFANWCSPTTWLHQGRWMDEHTAAPLSAGELAFARTVLRKRMGRCHHDPPCHDAMGCLNAVAREIRRTRGGGNGAV